MELTCANEAIAAMKTPGKNWKVPAEKKVARNTKLIYYADDLVGLKLHDTVIARYTPEGTTIDVRGFRDHPDGWFTMTTWRRINDWTPANTMMRGGLREIVIDPHAGTPTTTLYTHGLKIGRSGCVIDSPLTPETERELRTVISELGSRLGNYVKGAIAAWESWRDVPQCCREEPSAEHLWDAHMSRGELVVPYILDELVSQTDVAGNTLRWKVEDGLIKYMVNNMAERAVQEVSRAFPYPQLSERQLKARVTEHARD